MSSKIGTAAFVAVVLSFVSMLSAGATTITRPSGGSVNVAVDRSGRPVAFTVVASGFRPGSLVYVEQCDGAPLSLPSWSPAEHCDLGSSPAPAVVSRSGTAIFDMRDRNRAFHPFRGESPQTMFNCLAPHDRAPANGLPSYRTCRVRVSSNNSAATDDQTFIVVHFADTSVPPPSGSSANPSSSPAQPTTATTGSASAASANSAHAGSATSAGVDASSGDPSSSAPTSGHGRLAFTGAEIMALVGAGCALVVAGAVLARRRRRATRV